jgi:predicted Zn-dependent protease
MQDDDVSAAREMRWFEGRDDEYVSLDLQASKAIVVGQRRKASDLLKRAADQARRRNLHVTADVLSEASRSDPFGNCQTEGSLVTSLRACADIRGALDEAEALLRARPADTLLISVHAPMRRAAIELGRNLPVKALEQLQSAAPFERAYPEVVYLRGLAYLRRGNGVAAAAEFRKIVDHKGSTWGPRYPLAYLGLARAAAQIGDSDGARKAYGDFLELWKSADPDIPVLVEAKQEYVRLN